LVSGKDDLHKEWFTGVKDTGITGATSTPFWLMKEVENEIVKLTGE
jgi:4-hydroxy-3-methylbut-2-enyl diphosphate reductase IspH